MTDEPEPEPTKEEVLDHFREMVRFGVYFVTTDGRMGLTQRGAELFDLFSCSESNPEGFDRMMRYLRSGANN